MQGIGTLPSDIKEDCQDVVNAVYNPRISFEKKIEILTDVALKTRDVILSERTMDAVDELKTIKDPGYAEIPLRSRELPTYMYTGDTKTQVLRLVQYALFMISRNQMPAGNGGETRKRLEKELDGFTNSFTVADYMQGLDVSSEVFGYTYIASSKNIVLCIPKNYFALAGMEVGKPITFSIQGDAIEIKKYVRCCVVCGSTSDIDKKIGDNRFICKECIEKIKH